MKNLPEIGSIVQVKPCIVDNRKNELYCESEENMKLLVGLIGEVIEHNSHEDVTVDFMHLSPITKELESILHDANNGDGVASCYFLNIEDLKKVK